MNMVALKRGFVGACLSAVGMLSAAMNVTENVTLQEDTDWRAQGQVTIAAGVTVDLNGHRLAVKGLSCAGAIVNSVAEYQVLDYVESSGKQWINTGYVTTDQTSIDIDFTVTGDFGNHAYYCGDWDKNGHLFVPKVISKKNTFAFYADNVVILSGATNKRYRFLTVPNSNPTAILYDGGTGEQIATANPTLARGSNGEMTLFAAQSDGSQASSYRLHAFRMTDTTTGVVERDYVPVRRVGDGEIGLYDRAHATFYPNDGTAPFAVGPDAGTSIAEGRLVVDISDGATYAVSGSCEARVEIQDGSALTADGDLRCFGGSLEVGGTVSLNNHRLRVASLGGYGVLNNGGYRYYRFKVDAVRSGAMMQVGMFRMFCGDAEVTTAYKSLDFNTNSSFSGYTPVKCLDGNLATKWFDNRSTDLMYFIVDFGDPCMITRYQWYTGDDTNNSTANQGRNPKSWRFQGSNDGETWQDLDVVENNTSVTTANKTLAYDKTLVETRSDCLEVDVPAGETFAVTARFMDVLALAKCGQGTLLINDTDVAEVVNVAIDEGCLKIRNTSQMSKASTAGEIRIAEGAQLDINTAQTATMSLAVCEATHGKTIFVAGEGLAGEGAVINTARLSAEKYGQLLGRMVLTDNASICGRTGTGLSRMDLRPLTGSAYPNASLEGAYTLTLNAGNIFDFYRASFALKELVACGELKFEDTNTGVVTNGLRLCDGSRLTLWSMVSLPKMPIRVDQDATVGLSVESKAFAFADTLQIGAGATMTAACAQTLTLAGDCELEGTLNQSGASPLLIAGTLSGTGALAGAQVRFTGTNSCWRLVADDNGFTSKVDVDGVADSTFLTGLGAIEIVYLGEHPEGKVLTICPAGDFTPLGANEVSLKVTNGEGTPILNCWLETSEGLFKVHLADAAMPARTAVWTGAAEDGDVANPANWICRNEAEEQIPDALPAEATVVLIGANNRFVCTNAAPLVCGKIRFETGASLAMDCDWRGLAGIPFEGTLDLAGHKLTVGALKGTATITDTPHGTGFKYYRFKVNKTRGAYEHPGSLVSGDSLQVSEVKFFNGTQELTRPYSHLYYNESTFNSASFAKYTPAAAVDGNLSTKWYDDRASSTNAERRDEVWFILEYDAPIMLTHYEFYSGDDTAKYPSRQAQDWQLEGSNDLENWVMLDALTTQLATTNLGLAYKGPAFAPTATLGEVCVDVPAGKAETNATVSLSGGLRLAKEGAGTLVVALNGQSYVGGTVVREGVLKSGLAVVGDTPFGMRNTVMTIEEGAQYWDDIYSPWSTQNLRFQVAGTGPDGTGAIRTTHVATGSINNAEKGWLAALELTADAEIGRDAYAFSLIDNYWMDFPLKLNGHTLTFTSDTLTARPNYPYLLASSLRSTPGDTGTIVVGDNIQFYPYQKYDSDISGYTLEVVAKPSFVLPGH